MGLQDGHRHRGGGAAAGSSHPPLLGASPFDGSDGISLPDKPTVDVAGGKITGVALSDDWGQSVNGVVGDGGTTWAPTERLNFARTYTMTVNSKRSSGALSRTTTFSTLVPNNYVHPYIGVQGGFAPIPMCATASPPSSRPISTRPSRQGPGGEAMIVRDQPAGAGFVELDRDAVAQWRPESYYPPGTRIDVDINTFGPARRRSLRAGRRPRDHQHRCRPPGDRQ